MKKDELDFFGFENGFGLNMLAGGDQQNVARKKNIGKLSTNMK